MSHERSKAGVTLQVNVAPSDLPHAEETLRHQLRQWRGQVVDVIYTLDLHRSAGPRGEHFEERRPGMQQLMMALTSSSDACRVVEVDYSDDARQRVGAMFFAGGTPPLKDCFGAPFFAYFYGLSTVETRYVLHVDCDMLFGGGSPVWLSEAIEVLRLRPDVLFVSPLAGPPTSDARIPRGVRRAQRRTQQFGSEPVLEHTTPLTYRLRHVSSRVFLTDLVRLREAGPLSVMDAPPWTYGSDLAVTPFLPAETTLSRAMHDGGWLRLDYLGSAPGMWVLHPPQRGRAFNANLPGVIAAIERGDVPPEQRGVFELVDDLVDAVGPEKLEPTRAPMSPKMLARGTARYTGILHLRAAIRRAWWRRRHG
jgi:hypothetical protein